MYLLFDIGATRMRCAVSSDAIRIQEIATLPTPATYQATLDLLGKTARQLSEGQPFQAIAGGIAGSLDAVRERVVTASNMPDWSDKPLKGELEKLMSAPVFLENDCALGGLGEAHDGAGKGKLIVAYLAIGTGVGGVRIVDGVIDANALGFEPGHQIIDVNGPVCETCRAPGDLESFIGGRALEKRYGKRSEEITDRAVWDEVEKYLAYGLHNISLHWSPHLIVLGGSLVNENAIRMNKVQEQLDNLLRVLPERPGLEVATLGSDAGIHGALIHLRNGMHFS